MVSESDFGHLYMRAQIIFNCKFKASVSVPSFFQSKN